MKKIIYLLIIVMLFLGCKREDGQTEKHITRYGSLIKVKKEYEERYIILHRNTFPGVLDRIHKSNIRNYSIFLKDGLLFSHFEYIGTNFEADMAQMGDLITKDWWKLTDPMQEPLDNRKESEWWASMNLIYQMDSSKTAYKDACRIALVGNLNDIQNDKFENILATIKKVMIQLILKFHFQNLTFYTHDDRIYLYLEYMGENFLGDIDRLLGDRNVKKIYNDLLGLMEPLSGEGQFWEEMVEVFHTD